MRNNQNPFYGFGAQNSYYSAATPKLSEWRKAFGFDANQNVRRADIDAAYRSKAKTAHPDVGGKDGEMLKLNTLKKAAYSEVLQ